jgi:hypothetical protein
VAGCVEITRKGDLRAVMDDFSADVQDEGDQRKRGGAPVPAGTFHRRFRDGTVRVLSLRSGSTYSGSATGHPAFSGRYRGHQREALARHETMGK